MQWGHRGIWGQNHGLESFHRRWLLSRVWSENPRIDLLVLWLAQELLVCWHFCDSLNFFVKFSREEQFLGGQHHRVPYCPLVFTISVFARWNVFPQACLLLNLGLWLLHMAAKSSLFLNWSFVVSSSGGCRQTRSAHSSEWSLFGLRSKCFLGAGSRTVVVVCSRHILTRNGLNSCSALELLNYFLFHSFTEDDFFLGWLGSLVSNGGLLKNTRTISL